MNLSTVSTASLSALKSFCQDNAIVPTGDLRRKQPWVDAVTAYLTTQRIEEIEAEIVAPTVAIETPEYLRDLASVETLELEDPIADAIIATVTTAQAKVSEVIATVTSPAAIATYKAAANATRHAVFVSARFVYRTFILACLLAIGVGMSARDTWERFQDWLESEGLTLQQPRAIVRLVSLRLYDRADDWAHDQTVRGWYAFYQGVTQPLQQLQARVTAARSVLLT